MTPLLDDVPEDLRDLVAAERACPDPASDVEARVFARVAGSLALVGGPTHAPTVPSEAPAPALARGGALARAAAHVTRKGIVTFLVGAAVGATAVGTVDRVGKTPSPPSVIAPSAPKPVEPMPPPIPEPELSPPAVEAVFPSKVQLITVGEE